MLPRADTYEAMRAAFAWPDFSRFNIAADACDRWADVEPGRLAIIDLSEGAREDVSFGALRGMADQMAYGLAKRGVGPGDRVAVFRQQSAWTAAAHLAAWKLGAISVPLFPLFGDEALRVRLAGAEAAVVVTDPEGARKLARPGVRPTSLRETLIPSAAALSGAPARFETRIGSGEDPAILIFTSGTTGAPKGALLPHRAAPGHLPGVEMSHDLLPHPGDVMWTPADWAWIGGLLDVLYPALHHGVPIVASRAAKFSAEAAKALIERHGVTSVFFPPTALRALKAAGVSVRGLRSVASGGEPLGAEMLAWGREALGVTINEFYGQTECNMTLSSCAALFPPTPGAIGRAAPGADVVVIDGAGRRLLGEEGDIAVRRGAASMMLGYWRDPQASEEKFRGDWLITGDRGVEEPDGVFRFVGRDDDVITSSGYRIGPAEVEDCLLTHPAVASVGVVGKPDAARTQIVKAYVVLRQDATLDDALRGALQDFVKEKLAAHEYPREIDFVETLPMTVTGKIIRRELRARAAQEAQSGARRKAAL